MGQAGQGFLPAGAVVFRVDDNTLLILGVLMDDLVDEIFQGVEGLAFAADEQAAAIAFDRKEDALLFFPQFNAGFDSQQAEKVYQCFFGGGRGRAAGISRCRACLFLRRGGNLLQGRPHLGFLGAHKA